MPNRPSFTVGIEEEYLVVDRETRDLVIRPDPDFLKACAERVGEQVTPEYLQCQVEVGTRPHADVGGAIAELRSLRAGVAEACAAFGYAPIAASTHPFAEWRDQTHTRKPRYDALRADLGDAARRLLICGMHVHVCVEDEDLRIDLMNQVVYFLPHLLALSCSSPFWRGQDTGLSSYRLTIFDALPRTGLPDRMESFAEYRRLVDHLVGAGCIEDGTKLWWDIRPSARFPTVESRITDICPLLEDAAAIAALYQSLMAYLFRLRAANQRWRLYPPTMLRENRWRAMRYGADGALIDHGRGVQAPFAALVEEIIALVSDDAAALGCLDALRHARVIAARGAGARRQRDAFARARDAGADHHAALQAVVDDLIAAFGET